MFEVLERFTRGKFAESGYSEDRVVVTDHHFGVFDGSKGPKYPQPDVVTATLDRAAAFVDTMPAGIDLPTVIDGFNAISAQEKDKAGITDFRATGGFVFCLYSSERKEIWRVGDCKIRKGGATDEVFWSTEEVCARARAMILESWRNRGMTDDEIMTHPDYDGVIADLLTHEVSHLNRAGSNYSFGSIMGLPVPTEYVERFEMHSGELVITSDGYPQVYDTLAETEAALARMLLQDPLCIKENPQCKGMGPDRISYDDRAFIRALVSN